jgi:hypothetical protein
MMPGDDDILGPLIGQRMQIELLPNEDAVLGVSVNYKEHTFTQWYEFHAGEGCIRMTFKEQMHTVHDKELE